MADPADPFLSQAAALLGPRGLIRDHDLMAPWLTDWRGRYTGKALALAQPGSSEELAALVGLCARHGVPIVPQGGNSGMAGGATPDTSGAQLLVSMRRMNRILSLDADAQQITCEAGLVLEALHQAAEAKGLRFGLTLGGKGSATIGGLIATNAGGTQVLRHGTMRAQVVGLEAVLPDGSLWSSLVPLRKDNRGFDLKQLFIGSEGTLGIITAATLRLLPAPSERVTGWIGVSTIQAARELLIEAESSLGQALEGFEVLPQRCLESVLAYLPAARSPLNSQHAWHVLIEAVGSDQGLQTAAEALLNSMLERGVISDAVLAQNQSQAETFWTLRESISAAERARGAAVQHDIAVPVERMPAFVDMATGAIESAFPGTEAFGFGHLGDGNIHLHVKAPPGAEPAAWREGQGQAISRMVHDLVCQWQGTISAEHGIGQSKRDELARLGDPVALQLMRQVKAALDPQGLLNPGKLVVLAPEAAKP